MILRCIPSTDDDPLSFISVGSYHPAVADLWKEVIADKGLDKIHLKEVSNEDEGENLSKGTPQPSIDAQLERIADANNLQLTDTLSKPNFRREHEDEANHLTKELQKSVVDSETAALQKRIRDGDDVQTNTAVKFTTTTIATQGTSPLLGNRSVPIKLVSPSDSIKPRSKLKENTSNIAANISLTDETKLNTTNERIISKISTSRIASRSTGHVKPTLLTTIPPLNQDSIDSIATNMEVRFEVLEDFHMAVITLRNKGSTPIERNRWAMYVCLTTGMELGHLVHKPEGYVLPRAKSLKLTHLNGCSYKVEPTGDFPAILPGKSLKFTVNTGATMARSDVAPRWYIAAEGLEPRIISNTASEKIDFALIPKRRKLFDSFRNNDVADLGKAPLLLIPTPAQIIGLNESKKLSIDGDWIVFGEPGLEEETSFLAGRYDSLLLS